MSSLERPDHSKRSHKSKHKKKSKHKHREDEKDMNSSPSKYNPSKYETKSDWSESGSGKDGDEELKSSKSKAESFKMVRRSRSDSREKLSHRKSKHHKRSGSKSSDDERSVKRHKDQRHSRRSRSRSRTRSRRSRSRSRSRRSRSGSRSRRSRSRSRSRRSRSRSSDRSFNKDKYRKESKPSYNRERSKEQHLKRNEPEIVVAIGTENSETKVGRKTRENIEEDEERGKESTKVDYDFNWDQHRYELNKIFFRDQDIIKRGTQEYDDFWVFVKKYQAFNKRRAGKEIQKEFHGSSSNEGATSKLGLPMKYDKRYRINISMVTKHIEAVSSGRHNDGNPLTKEKVAEFKMIILHYLDFLQKQKLIRLQKLRKDQQNLPIYQYKQAIIDAMAQYQVIVVAGDTGCGKSTQVPQYLLEAGFSKVACTQPRRIACISLAKRVAYETLNEYGSQVAYQVRFEKSKTAATRILFLTEGLLLRQMSSDPFLSQYSVIVIDEVHERHIHTDFLLGVLKCLVNQREDLKIVLMSATININLFSGYFDDCPVIKVPGRLYPIQLEYNPISKEEQSFKTQRLDPSPYLKVMQLIDHKYAATERGDMLIFLSGMSEIMSVVEAARMYAEQSKGWIILPLHSALSIPEQDKVFDIAPEGVRKCIVSTNIAETSVTIDGVRFVVDSGKVKEMSYDPKVKMQKLQEFWISRASSEQRKGRAGRTGPGVCYRLYAESDYNELQEYSTPEIQRVPIDGLILQMVAMGLPDARQFVFIEPPAASTVENSIATLKEQGALTEAEKLTSIGEMLARLPVDVVVGKMLIMGSIFDMIDPVLTIAAALSVQSPFTTRAHVDSDAMHARKPLESDHGDPFTLLNAFDEWVKVKAEGRGTRKWSKKRGLEEQRFYEMTKLKQQFKELLKDHGLLKTKLEAPRYYTSQERRQRNADRKHLWQLKREQQRATKKRKVLKLEDNDFSIASDEEEEEKSTDVKDLEFRLTHDLDQMQERANESRSFTLRDVNILKIILCSGLYPQVAIADDCNSYKPDSEQAFHTKEKPFVLLHPTSIFATNPDALDVKEQDKRSETLAETKDVMSNKHQLLSYVSLLETTKPYLVNTMRVPALQTILLFTMHLDTNADCTRLLCDGWMEIKFHEQESAEHMVSSVIQLRTTWQNLLKVRLQETLSKMEEETYELSLQAEHLEGVLSNKLAEFLQSDVIYSIRRVLVAELKYIYVGPDTEFGGGSNVLKDIMKGSTGTPHPVKGGVQVNEYLTYSCLHDDSVAASGEYTSFLQKHWCCPLCGQSMIVTVLERLQHEAECQSKQDQEESVKAAKESVEKHMDASLDPLRKNYFCPDCNKELKLTTTEILKHKKAHKS